MIFGNKKSMNPSGNTLYGPNGQVWTGISSDNDAQSIISHNLNGQQDGK